MTAQQPARTPLSRDTTRRAILAALLTLAPFPALARRRYRYRHHVKSTKPEPIIDNQPHTIRTLDVWQNKDGSLRFQPSVDVYDFVPPFSVGRR